jgi:hypothetical protein
MIIKVVKVSEMLLHIPTYTLTDAHTYTLAYTHI